MINTDKPATWTVYTVEPRDDGGFNIVGTKWTPEAGPTTKKYVSRLYVPRAEAEARAADLQRAYDGVRRAALEV